MHNIKISVIIPVYNAEEYLKECLDSIINQTLKEIEIICIDDCSTDNSYKILEEYSKRDGRIQIFQNEKNTGGPSTARNKGIDLSKGEYLYFIDSDDYVENNYIEELYITAKKYDTDITSNLNLMQVLPDGKISIVKNESIGYCISDKEKKNPHLYLEGRSNITIKNSYDFTKERPMLVVWNKIIRRDFLIKNDLKFLPFIEGDKDAGEEDKHFFWMLLLKKPTFSYNHKSKHYRRITKNESLSVRSRSVVPLYYKIKDIINYCSSDDNLEEIDYLNKIMFSSFFYMQFNGKCDKKEEEYKYLYDLSKILKLKEELLDPKLRKEYFIIKSNDIYEKYLLQKELFEQIQSLDNKINKIIEKQNSKIKIFGIDNLKDRKIIYVFGIKITLKK